MSVLGVAVRSKVSSFSGQSSVSECISVPVQSTVHVHDQTAVISSFQVGFIGLWLNQELGFCSLMLDFPVFSLSWFGE